MPSHPEHPRLHLMVACPCCLINLHAGTDDNRAGASLQHLEDDKREGKQERTDLGLSCCVVSVQGQVSVLLVEQPVVSSATTAVGEQPALRCWGGVGGFGWDLGAATRIVQGSGARASEWQVQSFCLPLF